MMVEVNPNINFEMFIDDLRNDFGISYTYAQLSEPDWVIKEIARLGYAITINHITRAYARHLFQRTPLYPPGVDAMYSYKIWGPQQLQPHSSPMFTSLIQCVLVALYNVARLEHDAETKKESLS